MKIASTHLLVIATLSALAGLAALWVDHDGELRNTDWIAPAPITAESGAHPYFQQPTAVMSDPGIFLATLERPLFAPDRKQPPPPPPPAPPPAPDSLADARLLGVITGSSGAVLVRSEGRVRRIILNQPLGEWVLISVGAREATFQRSEETRVMRMEYAALKAQPAVEATKVPTPAGISNAQTENYKRQLQEDEERERRVAEVRARAKALNGQK